jgi:methionyl-tRNA synthetase
VIDPVKLVERYGLDQTRYFLLREVPFGNDGDFSNRAMINRINSELANGLGNLAQRSLSIIAKNCEGKLPSPGAFAADDRALLDQAKALLPALREALDRQLFHDALEAIMVVVRAANGYIDVQAPWSLKKTDLARMGTVLYVLAEAVRQIALLLQPVMPASTAKLLDQLAVPEDARDFAHFDRALVGGTDLPAPQGVFPRHVETEEGAA